MPIPRFCICLPSHSRPTKFFWAEQSTRRKQHVDVLGDLGPLQEFVHAITLEGAFPAGPAAGAVTSTYCGMRGILR